MTACSTALCARKDQTTRLLVSQATLPNEKSEHECSDDGCSNWADQRCQSGQCRQYEAQICLVHMHTGLRAAIETMIGNPADSQKSRGFASRTCVAVCPYNLVNRVQHVVT